jgi:hypothetical protein
MCISSRNNSICQQIIEIDSILRHQKCRPGYRLSPLDVERVLVYGRTGARGARIAKGRGGVFGAFCVSSFKDESSDQGEAGALSGEGDGQ